MRSLALEGSRQLEVREAAIEAVRQAGVRSHDHRGELGAIFRFVRDRIQFVDDIRGVETLQGPRYTLHVMAGDCDDRATLLAAMLRSIGLNADLRFRVIGVDPRHPGRFSHVYVVAVISGRELALDPTYARNRPGWQHPSPSRLADFRL